MLTVCDNDVTYKNFAIYGRYMLIQPSHEKRWFLGPPDITEVFATAGPIQWCQSHINLVREIAYAID